MADGYIKRQLLLTKGGETGVLHCRRSEPRGRAVNGGGSIFDKAAMIASAALFGKTNETGERGVMRCYGHQSFRRRPRHCSAVKLDRFGRLGACSNIGPNLSCGDEGGDDAKILNFE